MDQGEGEESKNTTFRCVEKWRIKGFIVCLGENLGGKREKLPRKVL